MTTTAPLSMPKPAVPPTGVTFTKKTMPIGSVLKKSERTHTDLTTQVMVTGNPVKRSTRSTIESSERREEILAVGKDGVATRVKVTYAVHRTETVEDGRSSNDHPITGKTYVVEATDDRPKVGYADGGVPSSDEVKEVMKDFRHLGEPDPFWHDLPERPLAVGEEMVDIERAMVERDRNEGLQRATVRFHGARALDGVPVGDFDLELSGRDEEHGLDLEIAGTVTLRISDGWQVEGDISGPIHMDTRRTEHGVAYTVTAAGRWHLSERLRYE